VDGRAFSSPAAGVRRYVWEIYGALSRIAPDVDVVAIGARDGDDLPAGVTPRPARSFPTNLGWMAASIPLAARGAALDVFHAPAYTAPLWGVHPQAVTIHDVSPVRKPEWDAYSNDPVRRAFYKRSALAADRVITDSEFSRAEITAAYGIPPERIAVVPLAAADVFSPGAFDPSAAPRGVRTPFFLHVGDLQIRRNVVTALDALLAIRHRRSRDGEAPVLVCAGVDRGISETLTSRAAAADDAAAVVLTGRVSDADLVNLYRGASALVYPSRYEGFGLPVVEAMRCGIPVLASDAGPLPEIVGDAGILLEPLDVGRWRDAMTRVLDDPAHAQRLAGASRVRAADFSWTATARKTLDVLRACAAAGRR
jgi:alpha-1,3-rhamnosyl/mannosyltransferase